MFSGTVIAWFILNIYSRSFVVLFLWLWYRSSIPNLEIEKCSKIWKFWASTWYHKWEIPPLTLYYVSSQNTTITLFLHRIIKNVQNYLQAMCIKAYMKHKWILCLDLGPTPRYLITFMQNWKIGGEKNPKF